MIELLKAAILGVVQGLTEFLPVSSSGHLIIARDLCGWKLLADTHLNKVFDVALHAGTFLALVLYFRREIVRLVGAFCASLRHGLGGVAERRIAVLIVIGTVPAAAAGLLGEKVIEEVLGGWVWIAVEMIGFGILLGFADARGKRRRGLEGIGWWDGIIIAVAQALALAPGVSRSGITMTAGLFRGLTREAAARFSFLLSIPTVGGTAAYSLLRLVKHPGTVPPGSAGMFLVGMAAAALSGWACIHFFLRYLQTRSLRPFVVYRMVLGLVMLTLFAVGWYALGGVD